MEPLDANYFFANAALQLLDTKNQEKSALASLVPALHSLIAGTLL
jgi:hypothetical protein